LKRKLEQARKEGDWRFAILNTEIRVVFMRKE
jgi:hypothetical protein